MAKCTLFSAVLAASLGLSLGAVLPLSAAPPLPRRSLLQGDAPNATLPNWFGLPVCSKHGSHNSTVLRSLPRVHAGILTFGDQTIEPLKFEPSSSVYLEPILVLALPGFVGWLLLLCSCCCFCYRRYRKGLCGEPIPTKKAYTPREVCVTMSVTLAAAFVVCVTSGLAVLVAYTSYAAAFADVVSAGYRAEHVMNSSLVAGGELLERVLDVVDSLDAFDGYVGAQADVALLSSKVECALNLLSDLPDGETLLVTSSALGAAVSLFPAIEVTDRLFADLDTPAQTYPTLVPPLEVGLATLRDRAAGLPDLALLSTRVDALNASVLNTSGVPTRIVESLQEVNRTLALLPELALLEERLGKVMHLQQAEGYICASIPPGWQVGDETECDRLQAQLRQAQAALEQTDAELPLALFASYAALAAEFPPLAAVVDAMRLQRHELVNMPNLTRVQLDYQQIESSISSWAPETLAASIASVASAAASLEDSNAADLIPELTTLTGVVEPLACIDIVLAQLTAVNESLLALTPSVEIFFQRGGALSASLQAIPSPPAFIAAVEGLGAALAALPSLPAYTAGVGGLSSAIEAMPPSSEILHAVGKLLGTLAFPETHAILANVSEALHAEMGALPLLPPFRASLERLNASKWELPPLIERALVAIERYDQLGDVAGIADVEAARAAVGVLIGAVDDQPDEEVLRSGLVAIDADLARMPPTQPTVDQLDGLTAALATLPDLDAYLVGLGGLLSATHAAPSVSELSGRWGALNQSIDALPAFAVIQQPLELYNNEQALLPNPAGSLLDGTIELQSKLQDVPALVSDGKGALQSTYAAAVTATGQLRRGLLGDDLRGYTTRLDDMRPAVESGWWVFLCATFAPPSVFALVAVLSCLCRVGRPALHAGHALMALLPWYLLLSASFEMPLALMMQDACDQMPMLAQEFTDSLVTGYPELEAEYSSVAAPLYGWVTGCPDDPLGRSTDPLATYFDPIVEVASAAQSNTTRDLRALQLRPAVQALVNGLSSEDSAIQANADRVHDQMACDKLHGLYQEFHTAICCDLAYALTAMWAVRLVAAWGIGFAAIAAIAGYKRFRRTRDLWGPYASVEALEVGAYL